MYITENQSIGESVLFLLSARTTLAEMVEDSNHKNADVMINFLMNEASDYEIVSLLTTGALPNERYNPTAEAYLFSTLKEQVLRSSGFINEMMGEKSFNDFMSKVDSVYPVLSTNGPVLEFFANQDPQIYGAVVLSEAPRGEPMGKEGAFARYGQHGQKGHDLPTAAKVGKEASVKSTMSGEDKFPQQYERSAMGKEPSQLMRHGRDIWADVKAHAQSAADVVSKFAKTPAGHAVGGAALAALLAYAAAKTYKRFFSKAAGACRGMSGPAKTDCMGKFRGRALMAQAADLQRGMASCSKAKNPVACKSAVGGKVERLKAKAAKLAS